jgi:hypothetical protein
VDQDGKVLKDAQQFYLTNPATGDLISTAASPALGFSTDNPTAARRYPNIGAIPLPSVIDAEYGPIFTR